MAGTRSMVVCYLNGRARISTDGIQWMVEIASGPGWTPVKFVVGRRWDLWCAVISRNIEPDPAGEIALAALPLTFRDFIARWSADKAAPDRPPQAKKPARIISAAG